MRFGRSSLVMFPHWGVVSNQQARGRTRDPSSAQRRQPISSLFDLEAAFAARETIRLALKDSRPSGAGIFVGIATAETQGPGARRSPPCWRHVLCSLGARDRHRCSWGRCVAWLQPAALKAGATATVQQKGLAHMAHVRIACTAMRRKADCKQRVKKHGRSAANKLLGSATAPAATEAL